MQRVTSAIFKGNVANQGGGAIYGDESSTSFSSNEYNHSLAENRYGFCFMTFGNEGQPIGITSEVSRITITTIINIISISLSLIESRENIV